MELGMGLVKRPKVRDLGSKNGCHHLSLHIQDKAPDHSRPDYKVPPSSRADPAASIPCDVFSPTWPYRPLTPYSLGQPRVFCRPRVDCARPYISPVCDGA